MMKVVTPVRVPGFVKHAFSNLIWKIPETRKSLYLTFDDGPTPGVTDFVLDTLAQFDAKATFFCIGKNVEAFPELYSRLNDAGHGIGNHSYDHLKGWKNRTPEYVSNVKKASAQIQSNLFRPPYGQIKPKQAKALQKEGYEIIMWSILSLDWDIEINPERCLYNVINHADAGDIIVFHDSEKAKPNMTYALPRVLEYFSEKGFEFKRIPGSVQ